MNRAHLMEMLAMQDRLNSTIDPLWVKAEYAWHRAIMAEGMEALDHYGWKWWKAKGVVDNYQIKLELVDIWHFAMSLVLTKTDGERALAAEMLTGFFEKLEKNPNEYGDVVHLSIPELFDLLIGTAGASQMVNGSAFLQLMKHFGLSWDELYRMYMAKNVLNLFRQSHGYKEGTYIKDWNGREDNKVLEVIMDSAPNATADWLLRELEAAYSHVK